MTRFTLLAVLRRKLSDTLAARRRRLTTVAPAGAPRPVKPRPVPAWDNPSIRRAA